MRPMRCSNRAGVPGNVIINHDPTELKVDAFACCVRADEESRTPIEYRFPKTFHLFLSLDVVHTSVNLSTLPCKTHAAETIHKKL